MKHRSWLVAASLALALLASASAQQPAAGATDTLDPDAMAALKKMGEYLRTLKAFQVKCDTVRDDILTDGERVSYSGKVNMLIARPDRMRVEVKSDRQDRMYLYDAKNLTIWAGRLGYYATIPAPPTLAELDDRLVNKYDIELPLRDLFYWGTEKASDASITAATDIGPGDVEGVTCEHYAFRQPGADWQVWIQLGDYPLPRKMIITTTTDDARPVYSNTMTWNLAPSYNEDAFKFDPPAGAGKITVAEVKSAAGK